MNKYLFEKISTIRLLPPGGVAVFCLLALLLGSAGCGGSDGEKARKAVVAGNKALEARCPESAEKFFKLSIEADPVYPDAYLGLAHIKERFEFNNAEAIIYYKRYLDLARDSKGADNVRKRIELIEKFNAGSIESPEYAARDIFHAVKNDDIAAFAERMSAEAAHLAALDGKSPDLLLAQFKSLCLSSLPSSVYREIISNRSSIILLRADMPSGSKFYALHLIPATFSGSIWQFVKLERIDS